MMITHRALVARFLKGESMRELARRLYRKDYSDHPRSFMQWLAWVEHAIRTVLRRQTT